MDYPHFLSNRNHLKFFVLCYPLWISKAQVVLDNKKNVKPSSTCINMTNDSQFIKQKIKLINI